MKRKRGKKRTTPARDHLPARSFLQAVPQINNAMTLDRRPDGTALASVPIRRPKYLIPPLSWLLPYSSHRRVELDVVGAEVLDLCDGTSTIEKIVDRFSIIHKLSFRESQLAVGQFLRQLSQRGILVVVGIDEGSVAE